MSKAAELAALIGSGQAQGDKNLIINGNMAVFQRNASASTNSAFAVDRFQLQFVQTDQLAISLNQDSDAPAGYSYSSKITINTAETAIDSNEQANIRTLLEGNTIAHLDWGTSDAKAVTLSFWVKSSATGTYSAVLVWGSSLANQRTYTGQYTINTANTWERKTISVPADTDGTYSLETGTGRSMQIRWVFGAGSEKATGTANAWASENGYGASTDDEFITTLNATWQITGVQLEIGDVATPFEHESYAATLQKCERYYNRIYDIWCDFAVYTNNGRMSRRVDFPTTMRANPAITRNTVATSGCDGVASNRTNLNGTHIYANSTGATGDAYFVINNMEADAEL